MFPPSAWLAVSRRARAPAIRLICLPYLGGGAAVYRGWPEAFAPAVEVLPVELPGHGARVREASLTSVAAMVEALLDALEREFAEPYALFGYSLGGLVAFEVARSLIADGRPPPAHVFVAAARPPHLARREPAVSQGRDADVLDALRRYDGLPEAVFADPEFAKLVMPAVRADLRAIETFRPRPPIPLVAPLTAFGGSSDATLSSAELADWRLWAGAGVRIVELPGGHFFLHGQRERLLAEVARDLAPLAGR